MYIISIVLIFGCDLVQLRINHLTAHRAGINIKQMTFAKTRNHDATLTCDTRNSSSFGMEMSWKWSHVHACVLTKLFGCGSDSVESERTQRVNQRERTHSTFKPGRQRKPLREGHKRAGGDEELIQPDWGAAGLVVLRYYKSVFLQLISVNSKPGTNTDKHVHRISLQFLRIRVRTNVVIATFYCGVQS